MRGKTRVPLYKSKKFKELLKDKIVDTKNPAAKGSIMEYEVATYLMRKGCHVFKNLSPVGAVDFVVMFPNGKLLPVDIKTMAKHTTYKKKDATVAEYWEVPLKRTAAQKKIDVQYIGVNPKTKQKYFIDHTGGKNNESD